MIQVFLRVLRPTLRAGRLDINVATRKKHTRSSRSSRASRARYRTRSAHDRRRTSRRLDRHQRRAGRGSKSCPDTRAGCLKPGRTPYDLRHAAVSLWLSAGVPPPRVAERAGHSVEVLLRVDAKCLDDGDDIANTRIDAALRDA